MRGLFVVKQIKRHYFKLCNKIKEKETEREIEKTKMIFLISKIKTLKITRVIYSFIYC